MVRATRRAGVFACLAAVTVVGCGHATVPVGGTVTTGGQPVSGVQVVFVAPTGETATGVTDAGGKFQLSTFSANDGALPGKYAVSVIAAPDAPIPEMGAPVPKLPFPQKYAASGTSGITHEVTAAGPNQFELKLD